MDKIINNVAIRAIAACVPEAVVDNATLDGFSREEINKIIDSTGVYKRHVVDQICTSDLCFSAAQKLLAEFDCAPDSIDVLIFVSQTPDYRLPATACVLQHRLGLAKNVMAFDINLGCSGYTYGLIVLAQLLSAGLFKKGLLLAGDTISRLVSPEDRSVAFLFGDAGSATLLEFDQQAPPLFFDYGTDGAGYEKLIVPAGGFRHPETVENRERALTDSGNTRAQTDLFMNGVDIFSFTLKEVPRTIQATLHTAGADKNQIDYFLFHQANAFMLNHLVKKMALTADRVLMSLAQYGNTSVASIPVTICQEKEKFLLHTCQVLLAGFGVGFSWATVVCLLNHVMVLPIFTYQPTK